MPKIRLTATAVDRLQAPQPGQIEYYDTHLPAFGLRVSYSGTKAWFVMTRVDGKLTRVTLGRYPALSLAEARDKARLAVEHAKAGGDPRQIEAEERRRRRRSVTPPSSGWRRCSWRTTWSESCGPTPLGNTGAFCGPGYAGLGLTPDHLDREARCPGRPEPDRGAWSSRCREPRPGLSVEILQLVHRAGSDHHQSNRSHPPALIRALARAGANRRGADLDLESVGRVPWSVWSPLQGAASYRPAPGRSCRDELE